jgi:hypothetical protein
MSKKKVMLKLKFTECDWLVFRYEFNNTGI